MWSCVNVINENQKTDQEYSVLCFGDYRYTNVTSLV